MATKRIKTTFAGAGTNTNILSGTTIGQLPGGRQYRVDYASAASVVGFTETFSVGESNTPMKDSVVSVVEAAGRITLTNDTNMSLVVTGGQEIQISVTAPGANDHYAIVSVTPL